MTPNEIARVTKYLRKKFDTSKISIDIPKKEGNPIEMRIGDEFMGIIYRDEDEDEISYSLNIIILQEDLPVSI